MRNNKPQNYSISGPFAVMISYLSEFHGLKYRSRVMMTTGIFYSLAGISLPALAWVIIPQSWNLTVIENLLSEFTVKYGNTVIPSMFNVYDL